MWALDHDSWPSCHLPLKTQKDLFLYFMPFLGQNLRLIFYMFAKVPYSIAKILCMANYDKKNIKRSIGLT